MADTHGHHHRQPHVTARVKDGEGWKNGETSFFRVNAWRQLAEHTAESLTKSDRAIVIGRLKSRSWETPEGDKPRWSRSKPTSPTSESRQQ
jgi:single-stranded DNA-binding protein